jgi:Bacterial archaeo-eukaryotic release factor family 2
MPLPCEVTRFYEHPGPLATAYLDATRTTEMGAEQVRVLVGAGGETLLAASLPRPPLRPLARWAPLPHVLPYLAQEAVRIPHVVVLADREGADISTSSGSTTSVEGSHDDPRRTTSTADEPQRHFQQRVEDNRAGSGRNRCSSDSPRTSSTQWASPRRSVIGSTRH